MSVAVIGPDELDGGTALAIGAVNHGSRRWLDRTVAEVPVAMRAAQIANHSAYALTYGVEVEIPAGTGYEIEGGTPVSEYPFALMTTSGEQRDFVRWIRGVLYNCTTNNGTDMMPERYRRTLEAVAQVVTDELAGLR